MSTSSMIFLYFIVSCLAQVSFGTFFTKCIDDLGCFNNGPPFFHPVRRPISLLPQDKLDTEFLLFTPETKNSPQILTPSNASLETSNLNPSLDTKILIHGFRVDLSKIDQIFDIKTEFLKNDSFNIVVVNWTCCNSHPYAQAVANARAVGAQVAKLINYHIENKGMDPGQFHVIGHSLGAHMSGYAGERVPGMGRITGLDPAGPMFYDTAKEVRLDPTDAEFVDVIHTDGGNFIVEGLGAMQPFGHMDFYPNGGRTQPGCRGNHVCDHTRAVILFTQSINNCKYPSVQCRSYKDYLLRKCKSSKSRVSEMGLHATKLNVPDGTNFFLRTTNAEPFCGLKNP